MDKIVLDEALKARLNGLNQLVEVCDTDGRTVGHFMPTALFQQFLYDGVECPVSEEELQRRFQEPGGRTLFEIFADLEKS